ncbi:hypothetical protein [Cryptosporangium sp. NPDC051539]|uniref:hypothetical protein n=1 Tax=Cryptosporangium sp. NPDC051539 TaxID=3363962 RepID=UPI0037A27FB6
MRRRFVILSIVAAVVVVAIVATLLVVRALRPDRYTAEFAADGVAPVTVTVPGEAGKPTIEARPAVDPARLPSAVQALSKPVRIEAGSFDGDARVTMTYGPATLPKGADPTADLQILTFVPDAGLWLPAAGTVDTGAHTITASTPHLSDWVLAVTDPRKLDDMKAFQERMNWTLSGRIASLMTVGEQDPLSCDAKHLLLPARISSTIALGEIPLCQEALDNGTYRLHWVNTTGLPVVSDLPPGFRSAAKDLHSDVFLQTVLQKHQHLDGVIVRPGKSLEVTFPGSAVSATTQFDGEIDWSIYLVTMMRQIMSAMLGADEPDNSKAREFLDASFRLTELWNCVADAAGEKQSSGSTFRTLFTFVWKCKGAIYEALEAGLTKIAGKAVSNGLAKRLGRFLGRQLDVVAKIEDFMDIARSEIAGLTTIPAQLFGHLDTSVTIQPSRVMTSPEAAALPVAAADPAGSFTTGCARLPSARFPPAGMPDPSLCYQSVPLDLNGNGKPDRLILWRPGSPDLFTPLDAASLGAVAYLDDGSFHRMADPVGGWGPDLGGGSLFHFRQVVHLGADTRAAAVVSLVLGSSTTHSVVLALVGNDLRAVRSGADVFDLADGGGAGYTSGFGFGCVRSGGKPLFVTRSSLTDFGPPQSYAWGLTYYRYTNGVLTQVGVEQGKAASETAIPAAGSDCSSAPVKRRGPEVGAVPR